MLSRCKIPEARLRQYASSVTKAEPPSLVSFLRISREHLAAGTKYGNVSATDDLRWLKKSMTDGEELLLAETNMH